jgi:hypothetical protein
MKTTSCPTKKGGRPATGQIPHITTRLPQEVLDGLERYVAGEKAASDTEAIRHILTDHLKRRGFIVKP